MKKLLFFFFIMNASFGQIRVTSIYEGSITLTPQGFLTNNNKPPYTFEINSDIAFGSYALNKKMADYNNIAIGNHSLQDIDTPGGGNIAIGKASMQNSTTGFNNIAIGAFASKRNQSYENIGIGSFSLYFNESGKYNVVVGGNALNTNVSGSNNSALGSSALAGNTTGNNNVAVGYWSSISNKSGSGNTSIGSVALYDNYTGEMNFSGGYESMYKNKTGSYNVVIGRGALYNNISGNYNTAIGNQAGANSVGGFNTFIGHNADVPSGSDYINATAIGYATTVDASNKVRIGNSAVSVIEGQVPWSNPSDRRLKENILYTNRLDLDFITRLQTVSYNYIADGNKTRYDGFIAQDVEKVMKELNIPFSGLKKSDNGMYSLAYSDFVMPLVNAVQELNTINKNQQNQIDKLTKKNELLSASIEEIKAELVRLRSAVNNGTESK
ncbi:tail fiber domain-containing protein [Emticicia sp. BO119]|uniref:tail fiber domain-containing protein n=1 Tax=Emticicia sp. BO119 TaxID=2757768 RepID=UPI0015F04D4C|nr:tail fiber domain-containing protein [Emticicia sp. BO119]MBA4852021.1 tail fiber domain-containing protein [Emticicia sp. BO119]